MSTKDWPRLMSVTPVAVVGGEDRTALRAGLPFYAMPAKVTDGDALGEDEVFLFAPAGHQPDGDGIVTIRAERLAELERDAGAVKVPERMHGAEAPVHYTHRECTAYAEGWNACRTAMLAASPARLGEKCRYCDGSGEIETDNNGPIAPCPICRPAAMSREAQ